MNSSARHTLSNKTQLKTLLIDVNLAENDARHILKLLAVGWRMYLLLVERINVSVY